MDKMWEAIEEFRRSHDTQSRRQEKMNAFRKEQIRLEIDAQYDLTLLLIITVEICSLCNYLRNLNIAMKDDRILVRTFARKLLSLSPTKSRTNKQTMYRGGRRG